MRLAIVGITGLVGREMLKVLQETQFKTDVLIPVATAKSKGKKILFQGREWEVVEMHEALELQPDIAIFSAGGSASLEYAPQFAARGTRVIDNSSAWRMDPTKKLIVPEINGAIIKSDDMIIANPNCSTIQLAMVLAPLHHKYGIRRVIVSTYQAVTGTGKKAVEQLDNERKGVPGEMAYPYPIDKNCLPHCDVFQENDYTREEMKLVNETHKIVDPAIRLSATAVRVPVEGGHSESVNIEFEKSVSPNDIRVTLASMPGVVIQDNPDMNLYPMPRYARGKNDVFVGRIRKDLSLDCAINLWIVSDNLRKGAATNAVQIAHYLVDKFRIGQTSVNL
jgi:aspartate-semialdehyde dehydrogenase